MKYILVLVSLLLLGSNWYLLGQYKLLREFNNQCHSPGKKIAEQACLDGGKACKQASNQFYDSKACDIGTTLCLRKLDAMP